MCISNFLIVNDLNMWWSLHDHTLQIIVQGDRVLFQLNSLQFFHLLQLLNTVIWVDLVATQIQNLDLGQFLLDSRNADEAESCHFTNRDCVHSRKNINSWTVCLFKAVIHIQPVQMHKLPEEAELLVVLVAELSGADVQGLQHFYLSCCLWVDSC